MTIALSFVTFGNTTLNVLQKNSYYTSLSYDDYRESKLLVFKDTEY